MLPGQLELTPALPPQLAIPCRPQICVHLKNEERSLPPASGQVVGLGVALAPFLRLGKPFLRLGKRDDNGNRGNGKSLAESRISNRQFARLEKAFNSQKIKGVRDF